MSKVKIGASTTREQLAGIVVTALRAENIDAVLVGGSVAAIYSDGRYVTDDLDFVSHKPLKEISPVMAKLGFKMIGNRAIHAATSWYVQFCAPPLSVGREPVKAVQLTIAGGTLDTLSPTDCVLDRLMKYYHWDDEQGLEQALLVAEAQEIDLRKIQRVSKGEGMLAKYENFRRRLKQATS